MSDEMKPTEDAATPQPTAPPVEPAAAAQPAPAAQPYQAATRSSPWGYVFFTGLVLLLSGLFWLWVEDETTTVLRIWLFAGLVATLSPLFWHIVDVVDAVRSRRGAASGFVILTTILGFVALGIVSKVNIDRGQGVWAKDTTTAGKYTLGEATKKLLGEVDGTIFITYLEQATTDPGLREAAKDQLAVYAAVSDGVQLKVLNALREGDRAKTYLREVGVMGTTSGELDDVVVLSYAEPGREPVPGRHKEVRVETFTWLKRSALGETKWLGERVLSDAIMELVFRRYKVYATGGHGERVLAEELRTLREALQGQNIEVAEKPLDLRSEARVPEDCDVLMILDPQTPFGAEETAAIASFLDRGRTLITTVDVAQERRETGLESLLDAYGIYLRTNYVVIAPFRVASGMTDVFQPRPLLVIRPQDYAEHPAVKALSSRAGFATVFNESTFLELEDELPDGVVVEPVIYAPFVEQLEVPGFAARVDPTRRDYSAPNPDTDVKERARLPLAATATRTIPGAAGEADRDARGVVLGDTDVLTDQLIAQIPPNLDLGLGLIQWGIRREGLVAVSERTIEQDRVELNDYGRRVALAWPLGMALLSLVCGGLVWWTRRR
jgi:hypothetical protein